MFSSWFFVSWRKIILGECFLLTSMSLWTVAGFHIPQQFQLNITKEAGEGGGVGKILLIPLWSRASPERGKGSPARCNMAVSHLEYRRHVRKTMSRRWSMSLWQEASSRASSKESLWAGRCNFHLRSPSKVGMPVAWRSEDGSIWVELRLGRSSSSYRIGWALWVSALDASLAVAAAMIFVAVEAMRPCSSPWLTLCWRAALSTGSDTLVYWNVTSLRSWRTSSIGIRADVGKSQVARLRSRGGHPVKLVSVGWASISPSGICAGVVELIWVPLFLTHWWSWEWFGGALDVFENPLWDLSLRALGDWGDLRCPPTWWEEEILRWSW